MISIKIADVSLGESEQANAMRLSFKEKLETAKLLEKLQIDIIETAPVGDSPADAVFIRTLASTLERCTVSVPVGLDRQGVDRAWAALSKAKLPRLNIAVPTSTVQMEYGKQIKAEALLPLVAEITAYCAGLCADVEFTAVDSVRSEPAFLAEVLKAAISSGAKTITLCDSVGELLPDELSGFISSVYAAVPELKDVTLSLHCRDSLGLASAAALSGVTSGARQVKVSSGAGFGTLSLKQFLNVIKVRGDTLGISCGINATALQRTSSQLAALAGIGVGGGAGFSGTGANASYDSAEVRAEDLDFSKDTDIETLKAHIMLLGYDVTVDDMDRIYAQFKDISRNKKVVNRDIEALIAETAGQAVPTYYLRNYVINSGSLISATAFVEIEKDGIVTKSLSSGDGPIDAAIKAVEQILDVHYELEEFRLQAVTGGREATGDALIKIRHAGKLYSGRGVSTDVVGASIRAFLSAVNKIVYEERNL